MLRYIRRGKPWAIVLGAHHEDACRPWRPFRSLEVTVYPRQGAKIGKRHNVQRGRFWATWLFSWGMCEVHVGFDVR